MMMMIVKRGINIKRNVNRWMICVMMVVKLVIWKPGNKYSRSLRILNQQKNMERNII
jgi:hypothetical protein